MQSADPCVECGGNALKLIDGYYYCVECNTQNTNVRETVVEQKALGDGTFAIGTRRKIVKIHDNTIQMSGEWYKWHAYNFIILGLADELIAAGAKPSFKLKLLWIWTRYIKKYQNKDALGFTQKSEEGNTENITLPSFMVEENSSSNPAPDVEENELANEETVKKRNKNVIMDGSRRDIKFLSKGVIIAMLYLALNLDESDIQLYHMYRFINEKRLNFSNIQRFLPEDIHVKSIQDEWLRFIHSKVCNVHRVRALAMSLLRKLDLGTPKVPDMRKIIDDFLLELCLPNDMKPMIYSLMFFHRCDFLDMSSKSKDHLVHTPDYEGVAMSYVLLALKMCFGLDGDYEERLSDVVEKINDESNLSKSYRMGKYSEPSSRLFSFREWCSYMQFRKITLCKSSLQMAELHCMDIDDYVYLEHMANRPQNNKDLQDETAINLINNIPEDDEARVIPKHKFFPTLRPMYDYTDIIIEHNQDQEIRALLSEDFTQYSLNYACENFELVDTNSDNIIKGVSENRKTVSKVILGTIVTKKSKSEMVYVKNCENRNWMITNPPRKEHVTCEDVHNVSNDKESDHGYDSEHPVSEKEGSRETENVDETDQRMKQDNRVNDSENPANEEEVSKETGNMDDTNQSMTEDIRGVNDSIKPVNEKVSEETENRDDTDESMKEYNPVNEKELSKVTENLDDTDQRREEDNTAVNDYSGQHSIIEDNTAVNDSENPLNEKKSEETENMDDTDQSMTEDRRGAYDSENPANEEEVSKVTKSIDGTTQSMKEDNTAFNDAEKSANENKVSNKTENVDDTDQSLTEDSREAYDSENPANKEDVSIVTKSIDDTDVKSMTEATRGAYESENQASEEEISKITKSIDDTAQIKDDNTAGNDTENEKEVSNKTENVDDTDQSMTEDSRGAYYSENPADEEEVSKVTKSIDGIAQIMKEDNTAYNDAEKSANEKQVSNNTENVEDNDQSMTEDSRGDESENPPNEKEVSKETKNIVEITDQALKEDKRGFIITEEDNDKNIFDDSFEELDVKDEVEQDNGEDFYANNEEQPLHHNNSLYDDRASISDVTDDDCIFAPFNPDTFDREQTIKELILGACKKYKCPVPPEYKPPKEIKPRKRKANTFGNEETPREPSKKAKVNRFEAKKKVDELISDYYSLKQSDLISQMQEAVSLAIRNNQLDSVLNVSNVTQNETASLANGEPASDASTRRSSITTGNIENQSNFSIHNLSNANPQVSLLDQNEMEQTEDIEEIDEQWESKVFEGEEEMKLDDLVPKGDPKFDEDKYDVNQLYIKIKLEEEETSNLFGLQDNPKLEQILNQKIEQCKNSREFEKLKASEPVKPLVKTKYESDSEDEIPLSVLQEEKKIIEEKMSWEDHFEPLINKENVSEFKYWFRHYDEDFMTRSLDWHKKFDEELKENTPSSFYFVIRECAAILNCSTFSLYKHLQNLEKYIGAMAKLPDK